jgi:hypothetical protein
LELGGVFFVKWVWWVGCEAVVVVVRLCL